MRRITNGVKSGKGFPKRRVAFTPTSCWADLAAKADLTLGEAEAKEKLLGVPLTMHLKNEKMKSFSEQKVAVTKCEDGWANLENGGVLFLGDIRKVEL